MINCLNCNKETNNPKFCSSSCSAIYNNKKRLKKECLHCGNKIPARNKYCNNQCQKDYEKSLRIKDFLEGKFHNTAIKSGSETWFKKFLLEYFNYSCSICGLGTVWNNKPLTLEVDHINGRCHNNVIENIRLLCPNCHSQTDTYKAKNIKSDNKTRYSNSRTV